MLFIIFFSELFFAMPSNHPMVNNNEGFSSPGGFFNWFFENTLPNIINPVLKNTNKKHERKKKCLEDNSLLTNKCISEALLKNRKKKKLLGEPLFDDNGNLILFDYDNKDNSSEHHVINPHNGKHVKSRKSVYFKKNTDGENIVGFKKEKKFLEREPSRKKHNKKGRVKKIKIKQRDKVFNKHRNIKMPSLDDSSLSASEHFGEDSSTLEEIRYSDSSSSSNGTAHEHPKSYTMPDVYKAKPKHFSDIITQRKGNYSSNVNYFPSAQSQGFHEQRPYARSWNTSALFKSDMSNPWIFGDNRKTQHSQMGISNYFSSSYGCKEQIEDPNVIC